MKNVLLFLFFIFLIVFGLWYFDEVNAIVSDYFDSAPEDLVGDVYYEELNLLNPNLVLKYYDSYGVVFYAVNCSSNCIMYGQNK